MERLARAAGWARDPGPKQPGKSELPKYRTGTGAIRHDQGGLRPISHDPSVVLHGKVIMDDVVIVAALRTAVGKFGDSLAKASAAELGAHVSQGVAAEDQGTTEISCVELCVRQDAQAQTIEEEALIRGEQLVVALRRHWDRQGNYGLELLFT